MYKELTKSEWITLRGGPNIPAELVMEYCNKTSNAGFKSVQHFIESFNQASHIGAQLGVPSDFECVRDYFDRKYSVEILTDKDGKEILVK